MIPSASVFIRSGSFLSGVALTSGGRARTSRPVSGSTSRMYSSSSSSSLGEGGEGGGGDGLGGEGEGCGDDGCCSPTAGTRLGAALVRVRVRVRV